MVALQEQKERVGTLLQAAVPMMCRNGLQFTSNFEITALIGIKIDTETFLVSINDTFRTENDEESQEAKDKNSCSESENSAGPSSPKRAKRKRKRSKNMSDKKARQAEEDRSSSESDNEAGPSPAASSRLEAQPVLALEETSLDTAYELNQTIADNQSRKPTASAKVKQENQSGSDSDDLVLVKEENMYNYGNHGDSVGGAEGGFPGGLGNTLQQASTSFGLPPQFHHTNTNSSDLQGDQLMDVSGSHLSQQDPQQEVYERMVRVVADYQGSGTDQYECTLCGMSTPYRRSIRRHVRESHMQRPKMCPNCGKTYTRQKQHARHCKYDAAGAAAAAIVHAPMIQRIVSQRGYLDSARPRPDRALNPGEGLYSGTTLNVAAMGSGFSTRDGVGVDYHGIGTEGLSNSEGGGGGMSTGGMNTGISTAAGRINTGVLNTAISTAAEGMLYTGGITIAEGGYSTGMNTKATMNTGMSTAETSTGMSTVETMNPREASTTGMNMSEIPAKDPEEMMAIGQIYAAGELVSEEGEKGKFAEGGINMEEREEMAAVIKMEQEVEKTRSATRSSTRRSRRIINTEEIELDIAEETE